MINPNDQTPLRLHPSYALEYWKLKAMLEGDPDFDLGELEDSTKSCVLKVKDAEKAALFISMHRLKYLNVQVETEGTPIGEQGLAILFATNPHFSRLYEEGESEEEMMRAVLFKPECMHYYSDDFFSPTGHTAILPQDLARDLFGDAINIQTDLTE